MPTQNPKISLTLPKTTFMYLAKLAKRMHRSVSDIVRELILEALENRECSYLSKLAAARDTNHAKRVSHDEAWKSPSSFPPIGKNIRRGGGGNRTRE